MADSLTTSVIAGLVVGISLIVLFATFLPQKQVENENNEFQTYGLMVANTTFAIPYRFSEGEDARIVDFNVNLITVSMLLTVDVSRDNTLEVHLPVEMLKEMESPDKYGYHVGDELVVFVDETSEDANWQHGERDEIVTIKLDSGSTTIEIVGTYIIS
jgi:hypothetical protein